MDGDDFSQKLLQAEIGKMVADARVAKNLTQQALARLIDTKQPSIARLEKGQSLPSLSFLQKIAKAFNTQLLPPRFQFLEEGRSSCTSDYSFDGIRRIKHASITNSQSYTLERTQQHAYTNA